MPRPILYLYLGAARIHAALFAPPAGERLLLDEPFAGLEQDAKAQESALTFAAALSRLGQQEIPRGARLRVLVSDRWLSSACVPWDSSQYSLGHAGSSALAYLRSAGHESAGNEIVRLADAPWRAPRLAIAYPATLVEELRRWADSAEARLESVLSLGAALAAVELGSLPNRRAVSSVVEPVSVAAPLATFVKWSSDSARPEEVIVRPLVTTQQSLADALAAVTRRLSWNGPQDNDEEQPPALQVTDLSSETPAGQLPSMMGWWIGHSRHLQKSRAYPLDAMPSLRGWSAMQVLALIVLTGACVLASAKVSGEYAAVLRLQSDVRTAAPVISAVPAPTREQLRKSAAVNAAITDLNVPVPYLMRALQPPKDIRVSLLGLEFASGTEGGRPLMKVSAESPSSRDMTQYVAFLADRKPFSSAYLTRHEVPEQGAASSFRFVVEVEWKE